MPARRPVSPRASTARAPIGRRGRAIPGRSWAPVVAEEFAGEPLAGPLFADFFERDGYDRAFAERLIGLAGCRTGEAGWALRRAAILMLESQCLALPDGDLDEWGHLLGRIAADPESGLTFPPDASLLAEGYSSAEWPRFAAELRARLARHDRVFRRLRGAAPSPVAVGDFLDLARQECKLTLARYFFGPEEVAARVLESLRTTRGIAEPHESIVIREEADRALRRWPPYERAVLRALLAGSEILWVGDATSSRLNALVEYPVGTVVLVVKPPGSTVELEIKRAGRRGPTPFSVVHERGGERVAPTHRLDGGSMAGSLRSEASGAALLARLFRLIHGAEAPVSQTFAHRAIHEVPRGGGDGRAQVLDYFTEPGAFGDAYPAIREAMRRSIRSFAEEWEAEPLDLPGDLGTTVAFLNQVSPAQAVLGGTSSYRLELVSAYLADSGPDAYFRRGLGVEPTPEDVRRFRETLLEEVLGQLAPGDPPGGDESFVDAVLAVPENRRRADAIYLGLAAEIGRFWGTVFGLKFYSHGESFVGRNVGLRSAWEGGRWRVRLVFMDHDVLTISRDTFRPGAAIGACWRDAIYIFGNPAGRPKGELDYLASIYRVDPGLRERGRSAVLDAAGAACRATRASMADDPRVRSFFHEEFLTRAIDWDAAAAAYLRARRDGLDPEAALESGAEALRLRGHPPEVVVPYMDAVARYAEFLEPFAALFEVDP